MAQYRPTLPFSTALVVLTPTYEKVNGVAKPTIPALKDGFKINASFRSFGGTERTINGVYSIVDTADVETWYRPDITSDCIIAVEASGNLYKILGDVENIAMRNQFLRFKIERIKGKA